MAEPQRHRRWAWLALAAIVVLVGAGCTAYLAEEGDAAAPILVQGRVVDASGGGMSGATLRLQADADLGDAGVGEVVPTVELGAFRAGLDGTFVVRLAPTAQLKALADRNGGAVIFTLVAFEGVTVPFPFSRDLHNGMWAGEVPTVEFTPNGVTTGREAVGPALGTA